MDNLDTANVVPDDYPLDYLKRAMAKGEGREVSDREVLAIARIIFYTWMARPLFTLDGANDKLVGIERELLEILRIHRVPEPPGARRSPVSVPRPGVRPALALPVSGASAGSWIRGSPIPVEESSQC